MFIEAWAGVQEATPAGVEYSFFLLSYKHINLLGFIRNLYRNNEWIDFNVSDITQHLTPVNADESKVYMDTVNRLVVKTW